MGGTRYSDGVKDGILRMRNITTPPICLYSLYYLEVFSFLSKNPIACFAPSFPSRGELTEYIDLGQSPQ